MVLWKKTDKLKDVEFICYVLGSTLEENGPYGPPDIQVFPRRYDIMMHRAKARTFNLIKQIKESKGVPEGPTDNEIKEVLKQKSIDVY